MEVDSSANGGQFKMSETCLLYTSDTPVAVHCEKIHPGTHKSDDENSDAQNPRDIFFLKNPQLLFHRIFLTLLPSDKILSDCTMIICPLETPSTATDSRFLSSTGTSIFFAVYSLPRIVSFAVTAKTK